MRCVEFCFLGCEDKWSGDVWCGVISFGLVMSGDVW